MRTRDEKKSLVEQEKSMLRALKNSKELFTELRWSYSSANDLLGRKVTDPFTGESVFTFELVKKQAKVEPTKVLLDEKTKAFLHRHIEFQRQVWSRRSALRRALYFK